jgi:hypothetical protein
MDGLVSLHRWALDRLEGKKGVATEEREEEEREVAAERAGREVAVEARVAADTGEGGWGELCGELISIHTSGTMISELTFMNVTYNTLVQVLFSMNLDRTD